MVFFYDKTIRFQFVQFQSLYKSFELAGPLFSLFVDCCGINAVSFSVRVKKGTFLRCATAFVFCLFFFLFKQINN